MAHFRINRHHLLSLVLPISGDSSGLTLDYPEPVCCISRHFTNCGNCNSTTSELVSTHAKDRQSPYMECKHIMVHEKRFLIKLEELSPNVHQRPCG